MSKKMRSLIIASAFVLLLCTAILVLVLTAPDDVDGNNPTSSQNSSDSSDNSTDGIPLIDTSLAVESIEIENELDHFTVVKNNAGNFKIVGYESISFSESFLNYLWDTGTYLGAESAVENVGDQYVTLEDMGLEDPALKVTIVYEDGSSTGFVAGKTVPGESNIFYLRMNDSSPEEVYITTLHLGFFSDMLHFCDLALVDVEQDEDYNYENVTIDNITLSGKNYSTPISIKSNPDKDDTKSLYYGYEYIITSPEKLQTNTDEVDTLIYQLREITVGSAIILNPSEKQLSNYGFDAPSATVTYSHNDERITLYTGKTDEYYTYIMRKGVDAIYRIETSNIVQWSQGSLFLFRLNNVFLRHVSSIESFAVSCPDKNIDMKFDVSREVSDDSTYYSYTCAIGSKAIDFTNYQSYVSQINYLTATEYGASATSDKPYLTFTVKYFSDENMSSDVVEFFPAGAKRYLVKVNGKGNAVVSGSSVEKIISDTNKLYNGEKIVF